MVMRRIARELIRPMRQIRSMVAPPHVPPPPKVTRPRPPKAVKPAHATDFSDTDIAIINAVAPYTMTSPERIVGLVRAIEHLVQAGISGNIVECGVWKGGSTMAAALTLLRLGDSGRTLHLFDTFEGMPPAAEIDRDYAGRPADENKQGSPWLTGDAWCFAGLEEVQKNLTSTGYPAERLRFVPGRVETTIPEHAPERIALLRLDTDWYESTRHELEHLYPRLVPGGVLILDDYGYWQGARHATDEYLGRLEKRPLLCRIDSCARIAVKAA